MQNKGTSMLTLNLMAQTKDELQETGDFFGIPLRSSDKKALMIQKLESVFRGEMLRCLKCLPIYELRNLQHLVLMGKGSKTLIPEPLPPLFFYMFGLLEDDYEPDAYDPDELSLMRLYFEDEVFDLVAPVIGQAISEVEESGRLEYERFLWGCLTVYGYLSIREFVELWRGHYPLEKQDSIFKFLDSYAPLSYVTDDLGENLMYPDLDRIGLFAEQRSRGMYGAKLAKVSLEDIISAGKTTPFNFPFVSHKEGIALAEALKAVGHGGDAGAFRMHRIWYEKQTGGGDPKSFSALIRRLAEDARTDSFAKVQTLVGAITDYSNAIPSWTFRGRSSHNVFRDDPSRHEKAASARSVLDRIAGLQQSASVPRVGRNDPCPCGSGLKYKNCHGKYQS